jgi:hypothetical protein
MHVGEHFTAYKVLDCVIMQLDADTTSYLWKSAIEPVLLYGLNTINMDG